MIAVRYILCYSTMRYIGRQAAGKIFLAILAMRRFFFWSSFCDMIGMNFCERSGGGFPLT